MRAGFRVRLMLAWGVFTIVSGVAVRAEEPSTATKEKQQRLAQQFQESLGWYEVSANPNSGAPMKPRPILSWTNATRGLQGVSTLVVWTDAGRPKALASVYPWFGGGTLVYECVSLARGEGLTARENGRLIWSPVSPGVTFRDVPDAPAPAETPAARLQQMRSIAERFKVTMTGLKVDLSDREVMRLLPKPIYRYAIEDSPAAHPELIDGALFAFVQGTDPEAVLMVEAIRGGNRIGWQYAFGRATTAGVEARLGAAVVWTASRMSGWNDPKFTNIAFGRPLVE